MRHIVLTIMLAAAAAGYTRAAEGDTLWVAHTDRHALPEVLDLTDADSVVFTSTYARVWKNGKAQVRSFASMLDMSTTADSSAAITPQWPGRAIWKPTTSDNQYNNNYTLDTSRWNFKRSRESEHFIVFWDKGFGDNPSAATVPQALRVDIDDLLRKAETFYATNVERLQMATLGQGLSQLDDYKMSIYLLYQTEWLAVGSGYDDIVGALWVNPSTCQPVGQTIGHEIGHSFQYQVAADYRRQGVTSYMQRGWRYGFGADGSGGNAFWEQCAQWQSFQDYPSAAFGYNVDVWLRNYHRHFNHEWMRYASYWLQYAWTERHGYPAYGRLWRESRYPEDSIEAYVRLFCDGSLEAFWDEYFDYATRLPAYQFEAIHRYATEQRVHAYDTQLLRTSDGWWQVAYASCPETTGINIVPLTVPAAGTTVTASFHGLTPGAALHADDPGHALTSDSGTDYTTVHSYNAVGAPSDAAWRYGIVAIVDDQTIVSAMGKDTDGTVAFTIPAGTEQLYFVVAATPKTYHRHAWDERDDTDEQWPYRVAFGGTERTGYYDFDPEAAPADTTVAYTVTANGASAEYALGTVNLIATGLMEPVGKAFKMQPAEIAAAMLPIAAGQTATPQEGKISLAMKAPTGTAYSYTYTANTGFWCNAAGAATSFAAGAVFVEYDTATATLTYGHQPSQGRGQTYTLRPTFVLKHGGVLYHATIELTMKL